MDEAAAMRHAIETPGRTAALVTPDRGLAARVSALLRRWGIDADDSAGRALPQLPAGTLLLGIAAAAAEKLAPVPLLALLKHPLVGGEGDRRQAWLDDARRLDLAFRGPRPGEGLQGIDVYLEEKSRERGFEDVLAAWRRLRPMLAPIDSICRMPTALGEFVHSLTEAASVLAGERAWAGAAGRMAAELFGELDSTEEIGLTVTAQDAVPILRQLLDTRSVRPPYGGHPRLFIWGLLEARLQQTDREHAVPGPCTGGRARATRGGG